MRTADIVCALIILGVGALVMYDSIRLHIGWGMEGPRAGFFPFLMSLGVIIGCLIVVANAVQRKGVAKSVKPFIAPGGIKPVLRVVLPAALMVFLTQYIGLYVAAGLYMAFYMRLIGKHRWSTVLMISIVLPAGFYYVFDKLFLIPMPRGNLQAILGF